MDLRRWIGATIVVAFTALTACSPGAAGPMVSPTVVRLGFFANLTHAPALVGMEEGFFAEELGEIELTTSTFNAGGQAIEALFAGAIDIAYIGPSPAINGWVRSQGAGLRVIAGATSGGASLIVHPSIRTPGDLRGTTLATPQLGNTQDVALRAWLQQQGFSFDELGAGDVTIAPQENAQALEAFRSGRIDGAWVPEPWATRLVLEGGGVVLVDERELWPSGNFVTTHVIVRTGFFEQHPAAVAAFLRAHVRAVAFTRSDPAQAKHDVIEQIRSITGQEVSAETVASAWKNMSFTVDPIASSLLESARDAEAVGLLEDVDLSGIYALEQLNAILTDLGEEPVQS